MRQYENLEMFIHAESLVDEVPLADGEMVAFMRLGSARQRQHCGQDQ